MKLIRQLGHLALSCICLFMAINFAYSQEEEDSNSYYQVSNLYHERASKFSCEFIQTAVDRIKSKSDKQVSEEILTELKNLKLIKNQSSDNSLVKEIETISDQLKAIAISETPRSTLKSNLEKICVESLGPLNSVARAGALANSATLNFISFPFTSFVLFWRGLFSREKSELGKRSDFIYRAFGPNTNLPTYILGVMGASATQVALNTNPAFIAFNISATIEMITNYRCYHVSEENPEQVEFCRTYDELKGFFHRGHERTFKLGHNLQKWIDKKIIEKRENFSNETFCSYSKKKQVKIAKRVLLRHNEFLEDERIESAHILLPVQKNNCTKILIYSKDDLLRDDLKLLEGIEVIHQKKDVFPSKYYFRSDELSEMPFEQSLCYEAETAYYSQFLEGRFEYTHELLKSSLAPSMLAKPEFTKVIQDDLLIRSGKINDLRNIIFSIGPSEIESDLSEELLVEQKEISRRVKADFKKIIESKSFDSCKQTIVRRSLNLEMFKKDMLRLNEISQDKSIKKKTEFDIIQKLFKKERRKLKLNWELIKSNDLKTLIATLKSIDVANIIIVAHGKSSGHLVDNLEQELPREAFTNISPSILSLNFYSCFSRKLIDLYDLKKKFGLGQSFYKIRYLSNVSENDFMGEENLAPLNAFGQYLNHLDSYLTKSMRGAELLHASFETEFSNYIEPKQCFIDLNELKVSNGSYAVSLNENLLGVLDKKETQKQLYFPCSFLKVDSNSLKIKNINNNGGSSIENLEDLVINIEGKILNNKNAVLIKNSLIIFKF